MTPFLSLDGLSAVDASGGSSGTSPLADGELGKAFLQQFSEQNPEGAEQGDSSDQALTVTIDPKGVNGSPIVYLNLETEIDPEALANVEVEATDAEGLKGEDLQAASEMALVAIAADGASETPQDTDSDLDMKLNPDSDDSELANTEVPPPLMTAPTPEENSEEVISDAEAIIAMAQDSQELAEDADSVTQTVAAPPVEEAVSAVPVQTVVPKAKKAVEPADKLNAAKVSLASAPISNGDLETDSLQQAVQDAPKVGLSMNAIQTQDGESPDLPPAEPAISQSASIASSASAQTFALGATIDTSVTVSDSSASLTSGVSAVVAAAAPPSSAPVAQPVVAPAQTPAHYVAVPADIASIISQELSSDSQTNHVRVQLDPPELGRVSLEFKFDSHGLQHVVVTADSADAIRRIRAFHPDLVSVLDEHGLSSQDMTFREQASGQNPAHDPAGTDMTPADDEADLLTETPAPLPRTPQPRSASAGLDIRV